jgi:hypothetical protein
MTPENKALTDSIMFVYHMLEKEPSEMDVETEELQAYIREIKKDETLLRKVDDVCFELLTALQDKYSRKTESHLRDVCYEDIIELVGKLCIFLLGKSAESRLAGVDSLVDGEVSESVPTILSYKDEESNSMIEGILEVIHGYTKGPTKKELDLAIQRACVNFAIKYPDKSCYVAINPCTRDMFEDKLNTYGLRDDPHVPNGYIWAVVFDG